MANELDLMADVIDVRDIIARIEDLREERDANLDDNGDEGSPAWQDWASGSDAAELADLEALMSELQGMGGDEQWEGAWYPATLIDDSYFETYAQELADDIGAVNSDASWPNNCIDWKRAARELQRDYSYVDVGDRTYWTR